MVIGAMETLIGFNPRPPRGERQIFLYQQVLLGDLGFQSTPPARGATEWRPAVPYFDGGDPVSIHAPREGSDPTFASQLIPTRERQFQSTPPARGATNHHLPRWGYDDSGACFNPRPPRGERRTSWINFGYDPERGFNPRPPRGERPLMRP